MKTNFAKKLSLLHFAMLLPLLASAEKVQIDGIWYNLVEKAKIAEVTNGRGCVGNITIPSTITNEGIEYRVISINANAFVQCSDITSLYISEGITKIGDDAFRQCFSLDSIFIPESVTEIGNCAFQYCEKLKTINIPIGVTAIGYSTFEGCKNLTSIAIPDGIESIGSRAFKGCANLTSIVIPQNVKSIGQFAFSDCEMITSIVIPEGVSTIRQGTFENCINLTSITIPTSVTSIESLAFNECKYIENIYIGSLESWLNIQYADIYTSHPNISGYIDFQCNINLYLNGELLKDVVIPSTITSIPDYAFYYCHSITSITINENVSSIGEKAFNSCNSITIIVLPRSLGNIGEYAFAGCENMTEVFCHAPNIPSTSSGVFGGSYPEYATLYVPANAIEKYRTTSPWSDFGKFETLEVMVEEINLNHTSSTLVEGESLSLTITVIPDDATDGSVIWNSSDSSVATVDNTGKVTAIAPGTATITATANDGSGVSASCEVTVKEKLLGKCDTPKIGYTDGRIVLTCETEGAKVITTITDGNDSIFEALEFNYIPTQTFTAYASKKKYEDSDKVTLTICWVPCTEEHEEDDADGILTIPSKPVLIQCQGGVITVSGLAEGTEVAVYTTSGTLVATATAEGDTTQIAVPTGQVYIVKVADTVVKIGM